MTKSEKPKLEILALNSPALNNLKLKNLELTQLGTEAWCAIADIAITEVAGITSMPLTHAPSTPKSRESKRQVQRIGVRMLLQQLLDRLNIVDILDESTFPYRLTHSFYYVCFSHSAQQVAVAISHQHPVGIDIELGAIKWHVAQRYYHVEELAVLQRLPQTQRDTVSRLLWQTKESVIKINQYTLAEGLGISYLSFVEALIKEDVDHHSTTSIVQYHHEHYKILILPQRQLVIVL